MSRAGARVRRFDRWHLDAEALATALLGQRLVRVERGRRTSGRIVETEAYVGGDDLGSHSAGGRRTRRNDAMFLAGGHAYVYFVYGMHHCFNVVAAPEGVGCAVLIRAIEPLEGVDVMARRRGLAVAGAPPAPDRRRSAMPTTEPAPVRTLRAIASGPARLCEALAIGRALNAENLSTSERLFIERAPNVPSRRIVRAPRVGIAYAGDWAAAPLRFLVAGSPFVSRPPLQDGGEVSAEGVPRR